jgi:hypothetical protein
MSKERIVGRMPNAPGRYDAENERRFRRRIETLLGTAEAAATVASDPALAGLNHRLRWMCKPAGYSATLHSFGMLPTTTGTASAGSSAGGGSSALTQYAHAVLTSAAAINSSAAITSATPIGWIGAAAGRGGFRFRSRVAVNSTPDTTRRVFFGVDGATTVLGSTEPSARTNIIGYGKDTGETGWKLLHNDGAGAATKTDIGVAFSTGVVYEVEVSCDPNAGTVSLRLMSVDEDARTILHTVTLSSNIPSGGTALFPHLEYNTGSGASAVAINFYFTETLHNGDDTAA